MQSYLPYLVQPLDWFNLGTRQDNKLQKKQTKQNNSIRDCNILLRFAFNWPWCTSLFIDSRSRYDSNCLYLVNILNNFVLNFFQKRFKKSHQIIFFQILLKSFLVTLMGWNILYGQKQKIYKKLLIQLYINCVKCFRTQDIFSTTSTLRGKNSCKMHLWYVEELSRNQDCVSSLNYIMLRAKDLNIFGFV